MTRQRLPLTSLQKQSEDKPAVEIDNAKAMVADYRHQRLDALGEAITVLKQEYRTYNDIAEQVGVSRLTIGLYHRLSKLPHGIRWKVEEGEVPLGLARQVCRLKDEEDQWMLAYAIVDDADRTVPEEEWKGAVDEVLRTAASMEEVLEKRLGAASEKSVVTTLSFDYWIRFKLCRAAWNRRQSWYDLAREIVTQWLEGREFASTADLEEMSRHLVEIANRLEQIRE